MKNFPSLLAVIGAWLCATGNPLLGIITFVASSLVSIFVHGNMDRYTILFFMANVYGFFRLTQ